MRASQDINITSGNKMTPTTLSRKILSAISLVALATTAIAATAQKYVFEFINSGVAVAIDQDPPEYPRGSALRRQEGWVRLSYVVTPDGDAIDPIIVNSSGGGGFELEMRKVSATWRFEPPAGGAELPFNISNTRFEIRGGKDKATTKFLRHSNRIVNYLNKDKPERAGKEAQESLRKGGWNLYESTILWLIIGRVEGANENPAGQLEMYQRALAMSNANALTRNGRIDLLRNIFLLESSFDQYAAALRTLAALKDVQGSEEAVDRLSERAGEIKKILDEEAVISASATIANPCDCDAGEALWHYAPIRRTFSFANIDGNVERFEARCERQRISDAVATGKLWALPSEWGHCSIFVFGDDGASFDFLEHLSDADDSKPAGEIAVARNDVPDTS